MRTMSESEIAYVAGITDGEGCLSVRRIGANRYKQSSFSFQLFVTNTNLEMLQYLKNVTGVGYINGPYIQNKDGANRRPYWKWRVPQGEAIPLLVLMQPWLIVKRKVTSLVFKLRESQNGLRNCFSLSADTVIERERIYAEIKEANRRGYLKKECELLGNPERAISSQASQGCDEGSTTRGRVQNGQ